MDLNRRRRDQAGFTLVEAMLAGSIGLALALPAYALLRTTYSTAFALNSRFQRNTEARQVLTLLGEGSSGSAGGSFVRGIRGLSALPTTLVTSPAGRFTMTDATSLVTITGDQTPSISIACTAPQTPMPACTAAGMTVSTSGWMGAPPVVAAPASGRTVTVGITVSDPYQAARSGQPAVAVTDTYRSQFNLNLQ